MTSTREVMLRTNDMAGAKKFYHEVLGFQIVVDTAKVVGFDTGAFNPYFEPGEANGDAFEFEVDDLDAAKAKLLGLGCVLVEESPNIPRCYMRDPFGLMFNLSER